MNKAVVWVFLVLAAAHYTFGQLEGGEDHAAAHVGVSTPPPMAARAPQSSVRDNILCELAIVDLCRNWLAPTLSSRSRERVNVS